MICGSFTIINILPLLLSEFLPSRYHGWSQKEVEEYCVQTYFLNNRLNALSNWLLNGYLPFVWLVAVNLSAAFKCSWKICCFQMQLR